MKYQDHINTTDLSYVYDTLKDEWKFETKTPVPWRRALRVVADHDIYFYNIESKPTTNIMSLWKYDTITKEWSQRSDLNFIWHGVLLGCHHGGKIYFTGSSGKGRNIIRVYDVVIDQWQEEPIYLDKKINVNQMLCVEGSIKLFGQEIQVNPVTGESKQDPYDHFSDYVQINDMFTVSLNGSVESHGIDDKCTNWGSVVSTLNEWFYFYELGDRQVYVTKLNSITLENVVVEERLPYNFTQLLFVPTEHGEIFLFGGDRQGGPGKHPEVKSWNHKIITNNKTENKPKLIQQNL